MSAALGRAPSPPPEDTVGQDEVSLFIQYFGKYFINASVHGKYFEPLDIVSDVCNCSARCPMTFSFHCIACSMNVRSMFVTFSVCLQGVFDLNLDVPRSRLSLRRPAAAHTSGAEAQPKVRRTEAPRAAPAPTAVAAELAPPALAVNDHAHPPRPDGLQDPPSCSPPACCPPACSPPACCPPACGPPACCPPACGPPACGPPACGPPCLWRPICLLMTTMTMSLSLHLRCQLLGQHLLPKFLTAPSRSWGICSGGQ